MMEKIKELIKNDRFVANCGIVLAEVKPGYSRCTMEVTENHLNGIGTVMGGAIFTLADFAFSVAANSHGTLAVSLNANISFIRPCSNGTLTAVASEISRTNRTGIYRVSITDSQGELLSEVMGTCYFRKKS